MRRIQTGIVGVDGCTCLPLDLHHGGPVNKTFLSWCRHSSVDSSAPSILPYSNSDRRSRRRALWPFDHHHHGPTYFSLLKVQFSDKIIRALEWLEVSAKTFKNWNIFLVGMAKKCLKRFRCSCKIDVCCNHTNAVSIKV